METHSEVDRLLGVYREYAVRNFAKSKWSPSNPGNQAIDDECNLTLRELLRKTGFLPLTERRLLDVGCGSGARLAIFQDMGARPSNLVGIDLIPERVNAARDRHPEITFKLANAESLPFADNSFELVAVFTVFSSILNRQMAANVSREISRVLNAGGGVIWYDFRVRSPMNRNVRALPRHQIQEIFPGYKCDLKTVSLLPPLARRLGRLTGLLYPLLNSVPFLRSHYLGILTKP